MAKQDKPTKAICWHGGWQALLILSRKPGLWYYEVPLFVEAAENLPSIVWTQKRAPKKPPAKIIAEWFWRTVGPDGLDFVERDDDKGSKRGYRITPKGLKFVDNKTWEDYEPLILEVDHMRSLVYYLQHLSDAGARRVIDVVVDELLIRKERRGA